MALGADYFTELITSTRSKMVTEELVDNVHKSHPLLDLFKDNVKSLTGRTLVVNLEAAEDDSTVWTDASGSFSTSVDGERIGAAEYEWSSPLVSKSRLAWKNIQMNQSSEQQVDLVRTHLRSAEKGHAKKLATSLHAVASFDVTSGAPSPGMDSRGLTPGAPESLDTLVSDKYIVGKIDPASKAYWKAVRQTITTATQSDIRRAFRQVANDIYTASDGTGAPTHIVCGRAIFEEYENSLDANVRYTSLERGETRFRTLYFDELEIRLDPQCPTNRAYFLDKDSLVAANLNGKFMSVEAAQAVPGTLDVVTPIASVVAFGVNERRSNGLLIR